MTEDQKRQTKEVAQKLMGLCSNLHNQPLTGGGRLKVYRTKYTRVAVEFYRTEGHTQSTLGHLGIVEPQKDDDPITIDGFFNHYDSPFQKEPNRIDITATTPEEAFDKMSNCLAPILDFGAWPGPSKPVEYEGT